MVRVSSREDLDAVWSKGIMEAVEYLFTGRCSGVRGLTRQYFRPNGCWADEQDEHKNGLPPPSLPDEK